VRTSLRRHGVVQQAIFTFLTSSPAAFRFLKYVESKEGPKPTEYEYGSEGPEGFKKFEEGLGYEAGLQ
jgi:hypothetical protein